MLGYFFREKNAIRLAQCAEIERIIDSIIARLEDQATFACFELDRLTQKNYIQHLYEYKATLKQEVMAGHVDSIIPFEKAVVLRDLANTRTLDDYNTQLGRFESTAKLGRCDHNRSNNFLMALGALTFMACFVLPIPLAAAVGLFALAAAFVTKIWRDLAENKPIDDAREKGTQLHSLFATTTPKQRVLTFAAPEPERLQKLTYC